ncbi:hypothetical protein M3Y98_00840600 [Aphelenchoides besseyi]|nr:hypothetical protein M3Y98_00840600 [Aphelenchoides besseyi]
MNYFWIIAIVFYVAVLYAQNVPSTTPRTFRLYRAFDTEPTATLLSKLPCLRKRYATLFVKVFDKNNMKISGLITVIGAKIGGHLGIFSSYYDAVDIFLLESFVLSDELSRFNGLLMWYYLPIDPGEGNQTSADFRDYIPFLSIKKPSVKQFGRGIEECGVTINDNVYVA